MITFTFQRKPLSGSKTIPIPSIDDAIHLWNTYRNYTGEGVSTIGNGGTVKEDGKKIATISYNGRVWNA